MQNLQERDVDMSYETKLIVRAIAVILDEAKTLEQARENFAKIAIDESIVVELLGKKEKPDESDK